MNKVLFLLCTTILISCSDNSATTDVATDSRICLQNTSTNRDISANSILVEMVSAETDRPEANVLVQLDHKGPCLLTDSSGFARFDELNSNTHDIHIMGKPGYEWYSEYHVDTSQGGHFTYFNDTIKYVEPVDPLPGSYVNFSGNIQNSTIDSSIVFSYLSTGKKLFLGSSPSVILNSDKSSYTSSYAYEAPENTSIDNEMWAFETIPVNINDFILVDAVKIPKFTTHTTTKTGTVHQQDIKFQPPQAKFPKTQLMSFGTISYPVGLTFSDLNIYGSFKSKDFPNDYHSPSLFSRVNFTDSPTTLTSASILEAYTTPFTFYDFGFNIGARAGQNGEQYWGYNTNKYAFGVTNVTIAPKITNLPLLTSNLQGNTISWSSANIAFKRQNIRIRQSDRNATPVRWSIKINGNSNKITLPILPSDQKSMLLSGTKYGVLYYSSYNYGEGYVNNKYYYEDEYTNHFSSWTR